MRSFLTKPQQALLKQQHSRFGTIISGTDVTSSEQEGSEPLKRVNAVEFERVLEGFKPRDNLSKNLALGVLFKNGQFVGKKAIR